jgi:hypothetical protein
LSGSASQLSVVSYELSDGSATTAANSRPSGSARNSPTWASCGAFGNVLSARMKGQAADGQDPPATARRANGPAEPTSKDPGGAVKLGDEKRIEDHTPAAASVAVQVLPAQSFVPTVQEGPHPSEGSLGGAHRTSGGSPQTPVLNSAGPQPPPSLVPASLAPTLETIGSAPPIEKQDTAAVADPLDASSGLASAQSSFSASLEGVPSKAISSETLRPGVERRDLEHSSAQDTNTASGSPVAAESGAPAAANENVSAAQVRAELEIPTKAMEAWVGHTAGTAVPGTRAGFNENSDRPSQGGEIPASAKEAGHPHPYAQPQHAIAGTQPDMPAIACCG